MKNVPFVEGVASKEDLVNIRMPGSLVDYNGNGDMEEGIAAEIEGLRDSLLMGMQAYATDGWLFPSLTIPMRIPASLLMVMVMGWPPKKKMSLNALNAWIFAFGKSCLQLSSILERSRQLCTWWQICHPTAL